jgi:hypothetical protein
MKRNLIAIALLALAFNANATGSNQNNGGDNPAQSFINNFSGHTTASATASANSGSVSGALGLGGSSQASTGSSTSSGGNVGSITVEQKANDRIIPVNSAIAPSVTSNLICPIITPTSMAASILIASWSGTTGSTVNAICVAYNLHQMDVVERMVCNTDKEYAKANPNCKAK